MGFDWRIIGDRVYDALGYFEAGGPIMIPLMIVSLWLWTLILVKSWELYRLRRAERPWEKLGGETAEGAALRGWQAAILGEFLARRTGRAAADRRLVESLLVRRTGRLQRHVGTILVLATVAPLIGLLGTVSGMITTFDVIAVFGTGNARALAGGISEALITTQTGLVVALPGLVAGNFISRRVKRLAERMERFCLGLNDALPEALPEGV